MLHRDPLISQILVASTYPIELVEAYQWLQRNPGPKGQALTEAAQEQNWDPSIQALLIFPDIIQRLNEDAKWTTSLGNAFLAQSADVMSASQQMRLKAQQAGKLVSTPEQQVVTSLEGRGPKRHPPSLNLSAQFFTTLLRFRPVDGTGIRTRSSLLPYSPLQ